MGDSTIFLNPTVKGALGTGYLPPLCCHMHTLGFVRKAIFTYVYFSIFPSSFLHFLFPLSLSLSSFVSLRGQTLEGRAEGGLVT